MVNPENIPNQPEQQVNEVEKENSVEMLTRLSLPLDREIKKKLDNAHEEALNQDGIKNYINNFHKDYTEEKYGHTIVTLRRIINSYPKLKKEIGHKIKYSLEAMEHEYNSETKKTKKSKITKKINALKKLKESLDK